MDISKNIFANDETLVGRRDALRAGAAAAIGVSALVLPTAMASASVGGEGGGEGGSFDFDWSDAYTTVDNDVPYVRLEYVNASGVMQSVGSGTATSPTADFVLGRSQTLEWSVNQNGPYETPSYPGGAIAVPPGGSIWMRCRIFADDDRAYDGSLFISHTGGVPTFEPRSLDWFED